MTATSTDGSTNSQVFTVTINDVDEFDVTAVVDSNGAAGGTVAENAANGSLVGITASASDADATNSTVTYSLSDDAGGRFAINPTTGVVTVANGALLDYEAATSHTITVLASSADGSTSSQAFTIDLTDTNDNAPVITSAATFTVAENTTSVGTVTATDADTVGGPVTFSISGGADAALFAVDANTGQLKFLASPDFEVPEDSGADNIYDVVLRASDGTSEVTEAVTVTVTDVQGNTVAGTKRGDTIDASHGIPELGAAGFATTEDDTINGKKGNDKVFGLAGDDTLKGAAGNDKLYGGDGDDILVGGKGKDKLDGGAGDDSLRGSADKDVFVFADGYGNDTCLDYKAGEDKFDFSGTDVRLLRRIEGPDGKRIRFGRHRFREW